LRVVEPVAVVLRQQAVDGDLVVVDQLADRPQRLVQNESAAAREQQALCGDRGVPRSQLVESDLDEWVRAIGNGQKIG
jgi:hypothetical protein